MSTSAAYPCLDCASNFFYVCSPRRHGPVLQEEGYTKVKSDCKFPVSFATKFQVGEGAVRARGLPHLGRAAPLPTSEGQTKVRDLGNVELRFCLNLVPTPGQRIRVSSAKKKMCVSHSLVPRGVDRVAMYHYSLSY